MPELTNMLAWWQWRSWRRYRRRSWPCTSSSCKRRPLEVPSTYLWHHSIEDLHVNTIWQRLRRNLLLLLQLLLILAGGRRAGAAALAGDAPFGQPLHPPGR